MVVAGDILLGTDGKKWLISDQIGSGTCCVVFKACSDDASPVQAAVKVYKAEPRFEAACHREVLILRLLQRFHNDTLPYMARVLDQFKHDSQECLVQELLHCDIRQIIYTNRGQGLSLYLMQVLAKDLLRGIQCLHQLGFVHGDMKPSNLLWGPQDGCLKTIDFSLSFHQDDQDVGLLQSNGYRSPEVNSWNAGKAQGGATLVKVTTAADMWTIGCILVEMFTGSKLFSRAEHRTKRHTKEQTKPLTTEELVMKLVQMRDQDKQADAQIVNDLRHLVLCMLDVDQERRITAEQSLQHAFFQHNYTGSFADTLLLPTRVLRLMNMIDEKELQDEEERKDVVDDIQAECQKFGPVAKCVLPFAGVGKGHVFVEYAEHHLCQMAYKQLRGRCFNNRTVITSYFLPRDFEYGHFW